MASVAMSFSVCRAGCCGAAGDGFTGMRGRYHATGVSQRYFAGKSLRLPSPFPPLSSMCPVREVSPDRARVTGYPETIVPVTKLHLIAVNLTHYPAAAMT